MKKLLSTTILFTAFSLFIVSCGGNKTTSDSENPIEEAIEIIEVASCCTVDTVCADSTCDTTKVCKEEKEACAKGTECTNGSNCPNDKK